MAFSMIPILLPKLFNFLVYVLFINPVMDYGFAVMKTAFQYTHETDQIAMYLQSLLI